MAFVALYCTDDRFLLEIFHTKEEAQNRVAVWIGQAWTDFFPEEDKPEDLETLIDYFGSNNPAGINVGVMDNIPIPHAKPTTYAELMSAMYDIAPNCTADEDCDGQIVIHTDLQEGPDGRLKEFDP